MTPIFGDRAVSLPGALLAAQHKSWPNVVLEAYVLQRMNHVAPSLLVVARVELRRQRKEVRHNCTTAQQSPCFDSQQKHRNKLRSS